MIEKGVITIVVPVYNEAKTISEILARVTALPIRKQIVVVDDASTDGTRDFLKGYKHPEVEVVLLEQNRGKGHALRQGFARARGEATAIQDADLEYCPEEIPKLCELILEDRADFVLGSRFIGTPRKIGGFWHTKANQMVTLFSNMCSNINITDVETGAKTFRTEVLQSLPLCSDRFGFEVEVVARMAAKGARIFEIPAPYFGRTYAEGKKIGFSDAVAAVWHILRFNFFV
ncbi:MAG: glycosyltransferase family 2 protein [Verrucomicrobiae bacterium]|nr:glycosyltransferase family 2 protein [Verrucomicrobiae bacterium]